MLIPEYYDLYRTKKITYRELTTFYECKRSIEASLADSTDKILAEIDLVNFYANFAKIKRARFPDPALQRRIPEVLKFYRVTAAHLKKLLA